MPWTCCGVEVHDNQVCMTCGARKRSHSMRLDRTRVFSLGFERNDIGVASAASMLLLAVTLLLTVTVRLVTRRAER